MSSEKGSHGYIMRSNPRETPTSTYSYDSHASLITEHTPEHRKQETLVDQAGKETPRRGTNARSKCWTLALLRRGHPGNKTEPPASCISGVGLVAMALIAYFLLPV